LFEGVRHANVVGHKGGEVACAHTCRGEVDRVEASRDDRVQVGGSVKRRTVETEPVQSLEQFASPIDG
jgi:hypothetical protein